MLSNATVQTALTINDRKVGYELTRSWPVPCIQNDNEVLVKIEAIGLNPIDWKSLDFGFGIPSYPCVGGRDFSGRVVQVGKGVKRLREGDAVWGPSTNYRDYRTSAFQQYAVAHENCLGRIPKDLTYEQAASIGVGAVTAAIGLGICFRLQLNGTSLRFEQADIEEGHQIPSLRPEKGDWLLIWGASSVTGLYAVQFAKMGGMRVIAVARKEKYKDLLSSLGADYILDRENPAETIDEIRRITQDSLIYAYDCIGKQTAAYAQQCLSKEKPAHLLALTGNPKEVLKNVTCHTLPIKAFHTIPSLGLQIVEIVTELIEDQKLVIPDVTICQDGLAGVSSALNELRQGRIGAGRIVLRMGDTP